MEITILRRSWWNITSIWRIPIIILRKRLRSRCISWIYLRSRRYISMEREFSHAMLTLRTKDWNSRISIRIRKGFYNFFFNYFRLLRLLKRNFM